MADEAVEMIESEVIIFTDGSTDGNQNKETEETEALRASVTQPVRFAPHLVRKVSPYSVQSSDFVKRNRIQRPSAQTACLFTRHSRMMIGKTRKTGLGESRKQATSWRHPVGALTLWVRRERSSRQAG